MTKCEKCGRTLEEVMQQDGGYSLTSDMPFICDICQQREQIDKQIEILRKAMAYDKIKKQLNQQKEMWNELRSFLDEDKLFEYFAESSVDGYKNCLLSIKNKMQELEKGEKDD